MLTPPPPPKYLKGETVILLFVLASISMLPEALTGIFQKWPGNRLGAREIVLVVLKSSFYQMLRNLPSM